jgi:hypothetical protein
VPKVHRVRSFPGSCQFAYDQLMVEHPFHKFFKHEGGFLLYRFEGHLRSYNPTPLHRHTCPALITCKQQAPLDSNGVWLEAGS